MDNRTKLLTKVKEEIPGIDASNVLMVNDRQKSPKRSKTAKPSDSFYDMTIIISFKSQFRGTVYDLLFHKNEGLVFPYGIEDNVGNSTCDLCIVLNSGKIRNLRSLLNKVKIKHQGDWDFRLISVSLREDSKFLNNEG